ncbi:MAG: TrkH family potassium uptake protein [Clostridia bacterium]|nr:TrkH family potassium uptake protein [Clostridia bacterium]
MNYRIIFYTLGWVLNIEAFCLLLPAICSLCYSEPYFITFLICIGLCLLFGVPLVVKSPKNKTMFAKEGYITVALSWIIISIFGALPFVFSGSIPNFIDALFETASGFTTTGASILTDVEALPKSILFWRSFTHWIGGMGVLVFLVAILPLFGGSNLNLIKAESPGPSVSKLVPKVKTTAKLLYSMYLGMTVIEIILLLLGGLNLFEALTLSFGTAGTGGFAILNSGLATYSSYVQIVITIFMVLFGVDFSVYYLLLMRKFKSAIRSDEVRVYFTVFAISSIIIAVNCLNLFNGFGESLKYAAFQVGSIMTTTGYSTTDFDLWPQLSKTLLVLLMFMGACAGSTGGGIKVSRIMILFKSIIKEIKIAAHPKSTHKITMNGRIVEHETVRAVNVFMMAYLAIFAIALIVISLDNMGFTTNFTAVVATLSNIGPGLEAVGPTQNFSAYSPLSTLILTFAMLAGRLEIFPMLVLLSPYTWKK